MSQRADRPTRLCFVETAYSAFTSHRKHLARAALAEGMEVHLIAPGIRLPKPAGFEHVTFHELRLDRSGVDPLREISVVLSLKRHYQAIQPDIVHHFALKSVLYGAVAARLAKVPCALGTLTGLGYTFIPGGFSRRVLKLVVSNLLRVALRGVNHTTFQNPEDRAFFIDEGVVSAERSSVIIGSGVDIEEFFQKPEPEGIPVVLVGSRMLWDKGIREVVDAARRLRADGVCFRLQLAGTPDPENPASVPEAVLRRWHNDGLVEWLGARNDMPELLARCHIACLPSYREGLPVFLAEAAAAGRPSVTTNVPGCSTAVLDERTGLLVPARDSNHLAHALRRLIDDAEFRQKLGGQARAYAEAVLSSHKVSAAFVRLYQMMLLEAEAWRAR